MTGLFKSGHGRDILIDTGHTDLQFTHNGSEWALDRNGWSVVYTKEVDGVRQMWRGYLEGKKVVAETHYLRRDSSVWWRGLHQPQCRLDTDHCDFGRLGRRRKGLGGRERRHSATPDRAVDSTIRMAAGSPAPTCW